MIEFDQTKVSPTQAQLGVNNHQPHISNIMGSFFMMGVVMGSEENKLGAYNYDELQTIV